MPFTKFVHLHVHSEYSLLDGACRLEALVDRAKALHMPALALTDHGVLYGAIDFYHRCLRHGIKPIIGMEAYVAPGSRFDRKSDHGMKDAAHHLVLLARDFEGYQNLVALSSIGFLQGFYYRPRIDKAVLAQHAKGLIGLSACLKGEIAQLLLKNELPLARQVAEEYGQLFGEGHFYLELMNQHLPQQGLVNRGLIDLARETGLPVVATNDVHYLKRDDALAQEVLMCLQTGQTLNDEKHMHLETREFYLKSGEEMEHLFSEIPEAGRHTLDIANHCNLEMPSGRMQLPHYPIPENEIEIPSQAGLPPDLDAYLEARCRQAMAQQDFPDRQAVESRLSLELDVIKKMGYAAYFLIVWDFISYAKKIQVPVGPGRGSVAGSLVAYLLGITEINPLRYGLIFERFLNPERISMPDIDVDFSDIGREKIIRYVTEKYGQENVAQIITFGTMAARAAVRDVGRVLTLAYELVDKVAKLIPFGPEMTISRALEQVPELKALAEDNGQVQQLLTIAMTLEGQARHASTHAAGIVISKDPLLTLVPLCHTKQPKIQEPEPSGNASTLTTQYAMESLERLGLLKMDFLGLRTLTVIDETLKAVEAQTGRHLDLQALTYDDAATFTMLGEGQTSGVFQLESAGMRDLLKRLKPQSLEEISALNALYRPGPMAIIDDYIGRKQGRLPIRYPHPELESILKETYGTIVYQEQVMQIAVRLGGFTYGQADLLRRAMGKKNRELIEQQRDVFVKGAQTKKIPAEQAEAIFDLMARFGEYGFNKSHSLAYAVLAYQTAYLKANYAPYFAAAVLSSEMHNTDKIAAYIQEYRRQQIALGLPDINKSFDRFIVVDQKIQFGLAAIKNVGQGAAKLIVQEREAQGLYASFDDFCERLELRTVNQRAIESLIKAGAFDHLTATRRALLLQLEASLSRAQKIQEERALGQMAMFDQSALTADREKSVSIPENEKDRLAGEKEVLGFYLTGHPLTEFQDLLRTFNSQALTQLNKVEEGRPVVVGGIILGVKHSLTKRKEPMLRFNLENFDGLVEVMVWPDTLGSHRHYLHKDEMVFVQGRLDRSGEDNKIVAHDIIPFQEAYSRLSRQLVLTLHPTLGEEQLLAIKEILTRHSGNTPVVLRILSVHHGQVVEKLPERFQVTVSHDLIQALTTLMRSEDIEIKSAAG